MRRRVVIIAAGLVLVAVAGYLAYNNSNRANAAVRSVQTATVTRGTLSATVNSAGPVAARVQAALNFGASGTVKKVYVQLGDRVKQGQVLAEADATALQFSLANAQFAMNQQQLKYDQTVAGTSASDLATARSNVDAAQANYDSAVRKAGLNDEQLLMLRNSLDKSALALQQAQTSYEQAVADRVADLSTVAVALKQANLDYSSAQANYNIQVSGIDDSAVRNAASTLAAAKANLLTLESAPTPQDLQAAQMQLDQSKLSLQEAQYNMRSVQLIAPFDGTVTQLNIYDFSSTSAGSPAIQISDLSNLQVTVNMAEVDIGKVKIGQDSTIVFDALPDSPTLNGTVTQIALVGTTTQGVVNYPVVVSLKDPDPSVIKTGMTANIAIVVDRRDNVLLVPNRAIRAQGRQRVVQVQTALGAITSPVTIGLQNDSFSEVQSGLKEGDVVIINTTPASTTNAPGGGGFGGGPGGLPFIGR